MTETQLATKRWKHEQKRRAWKRKGPLAQKHRFEAKSRRYHKVTPKVNIMDNLKKQMDLSLRVFT